MYKGLLILILALLITGCETPFFKAVDGTDLEIGVSLPQNEEIKLQVLHYLSGELVSVRDPSIVEYSFQHTASNSYMGLFETSSTRNSKIKVQPKKVEDNDTTNNINLKND